VGRAFRVPNGRWIEATGQLAGRRPNICAPVSRGVKGGETATLVCGFYGAGEGGVTAFTEYGHRVLEVRGVQFSTGQF